MTCACTSTSVSRPLPPSAQSNYNAYRVSWLIRGMFMLYSWLYLHQITSDCSDFTVPSSSVLASLLDPAFLHQIPLLFRHFKRRHIWCTMSPVKRCTSDLLQLLSAVRMVSALSWKLTSDLHPGCASAFAIIQFLPIPGGHARASSRAF